MTTVTVNPNGVIQQEPEETVQDTLKSLSKEVSSLSFRLPPPSLEARGGIEFWQVALLCVGAFTIGWLLAKGSKR